ncbi:hypothetical protein HPB52_020007 [Rhipicephalus sanguineus]|uniref:Uncharacterized protein n=1 Tax=Rhipicephalus sanguineus TaxID=34632 RepID=A0A9D4QGT9_RHISA|nr:hypothetical protein HPB52_020007 [Rhipicephalus sanguineus]
MTASTGSGKGECVNSGDYDDTERQAPVGEPTVDEALAVAAVDGKSWKSATRAAKGAKTQAEETIAAAATMAKAKEEAASEGKGEKAVKSARSAPRKADKVMKGTVMATTHEEPVRSLRTSGQDNAAQVRRTAAIVSTTFSADVQL